MSTIPFGLQDNQNSNVLVTLTDQAGNAAAQPAHAILNQPSHPAARGWVITQQEPELYAIADELNVIGQRQLHRGCDVALGAGTRDPLNVCTRLLIRTMSNFQGAIVLIGRGMTVEAQTLVRGCYENAFWVGFFFRDPPEAGSAFELDEIKSQIGRRDALVRIADSVGDQTMHDRIRQLVGGAQPKPAGRAPSLEELAILAGMHAHYAFYRQLSADSAHPSLHSIDRYLDKNVDGDWVGFVLGPDNVGVHDALSLACHSMVTALAGFGQLIGATEDDEPLLQVYQRYRSVAGITTPE